MSSPMTDAAVEKILVELEWCVVEIKRLRAALATAEGAAWQPIETAPPNVKVLLFCPDRGCESNCARVELDCASYGWNNEVANNMSFHSWATHWRPLPSPPMEVDRG